MVYMRIQRRVKKKKRTENENKNLWKGFRWTFSFFLSFKPCHVSTVCYDCCSNHHSSRAQSGHHLPHTQSPNRSRCRARSTICLPIMCNFDFTHFTSAAQCRTKNGKQIKTKKTRKISSILILAKNVRRVRRAAEKSKSLFIYFCSIRCWLLYMFSHSAHFCRSTSSRN